MQPKRTISAICLLSLVLCSVSVTCSDFVKNARRPLECTSWGLNYAPSVARQLVSRSPSASASLSDRVLARLVEAESKEIDVWSRDDIRIARITVGLASQGRDNAYVVATYQVLGIHPDKVWPAIVARRKAVLGASYDNFFGAKLPPKKPAEVARVGVEVAKAATA